MPIEQVSIRNYKSLKNLSLKMEPFMVFVGPNNSGKSNILDAFRFLADLMRDHDFQGGIRKRGGSKQIVSDGDLGQAISLKLHGSLGVEDKVKKYSYSVQLAGDQWGNCQNKKETLTLAEEEKRILLDFPSDDGMANAYDEAGIKTGGFGGGYTRLYLSQFTDRHRYRVICQLSYEVQSWAFFNLLPPLMREPLPVHRQGALQSSGDNLAVVIHTLQSEEPQRFQEIVDILRTPIPCV